MLAESRFWALLRAGLWNCEVDFAAWENGPDVDWNIVYELACQQALVGIVFDGIGHLPAPMCPPQKMVLKWYAEVVRIERANVAVDQALFSLLSLYKKEGIVPLLLKGQGIGRLYPCPSHRQPGDIDLFMPDDYERSKTLLKEKGIALVAECEKHVEYIFQGVVVENHKYAACFYNPCRNRKLQKWASRWMKEDPERWLGGEQDVCVPPAGFNVVFLLIHMLLHFIPSGIGLRQVCDWALLLRTYHQEIDWNRLGLEIRELGLEHALQAFGYVAVHYLGLPAACLPGVDVGSCESGEFLVRDILQGGNFGMVRAEKNVPEGKWERLWHNYKVVCRRCRTLIPCWGDEARWYPYFRALNWLNKKGKGLD